MRLGFTPATAARWRRPWFGVHLFSRGIVEVPAATVDENRWPVLDAGAKEVEGTPVGSSSSSRAPRTLLPCVPLCRTLASTTSAESQFVALHRVELDLEEAPSRLTSSSTPSRTPMTCRVSTDMSPVGLGFVLSWKSRK